MPRAEADKKTLRRSKAFAKKLRDEREDSGMSQSELANKAKVSVDTIRALERNKVKVPGVFLFLDLIKALDGEVQEWIETIK